MRLPPLNALRAFEATARHLSFSLAAEELNVTPGALSHQVRGLEDVLEVKLFHRQARAISLTEAGHALYPGVRSGFLSFEDAITQLRRMSDDEILVISVGPSFTAKWLAPRLSRFMAKEPDIDARISANLKRSDFTSDGVDIAIRFGKGDYPGLHVEWLMGEAVLPLCTPQLREREQINEPSDLDRVTLIHDESISVMSDGTTWADWLEVAGTNGVDASRGLRFNLADHAIDAAVEGAGVVLGRRVMAEADLRSGRLVAPFELELAVEGLGFFLVCPLGTENRKPVRAFREWIIAETALTCPQRVAKTHVC